MNLEGYKISEQLLIIDIGTSLMAQWLRICLPMQGTWVQALVWEDPTCRGAAKPMHHNYWAHVPKLLKPVCPRALVPQLLSPRTTTTEAHEPRAHAPQQEKPLLTSTRENPHAAMKTQHSQKINKIKKKHPPLKKTFDIYRTPEPMKTE